MRKQHGAEMRRILHRTWRALPLLIACALAACTGGSGSSGFDSLENAAISEALDQQRCVENEGLLICPSDRERTPSAPPSSPTPTATASVGEPRTPSPSMTAEAADTTPTPSIPPILPTATQQPEASATSPRTATMTRTATPTTTPGVRVDTDVRDVESIECQLDAQNRCTFAFAFSTQGLPPDATYRVAVRTDAGSWMILEPALTGPLDAPSFETSVSLETQSASGTPAEAQFAVLVYLEPPADVPARVARLGDSGADLAFVTPQISVSSRQ